MPEGAGGVFVPGGTVGNLSAMVAARHDANVRAGDDRPTRWAFLASRETHSSVKAACQVMDADVILVWASERRIITGADLLGRLMRGIARKREASKARSAGRVMEVEPSSID